MLWTEIIANARHLPYDLPTQWKLAEWAPATKDAVLAAMEAGRPVMVVASIPWVTPNGASGVDIGVMTGWGGQEYTSYTWRKYIGCANLFGGGKVIYDYYVSSARPRIEKVGWIIEYR